MKNLFDYATKELSQDAFLRWFFENYDDNQVGPIVIDFINRFTQNQQNNRKPFNLKYADITKLVSYSQVNDIDISIDFWCDKLFDGHRTIVIEDKTDSEEHNQLTIYNDAISRWSYEGKLSPDECVYKVFYKTHLIGEKEHKRVEEAGWTPFGIDEIHNFFNGYLNKTTSDVLNDYIRHIADIHSCYKQVSNKKAIEWNSINWETFFNKYMESHKEVEHNFTSYRGIYSSMLLYLDINKNSYLTYVAFEIQIRDNLKPYLHPGLHIGDKWEWSIGAFEDEPYYEECKKELDDLRDFIEQCDSPIIKRGNSVRSFGKINDTIGLNKNADELASELDKWVNEFIRIIDLYNKTKNK